MAEVAMRPAAVMLALAWAGLGGATPFGKAVDTITKDGCSALGSPPPGGLCFEQPLSFRIC